MNQKEMTLIDLLLVVVTAIIIFAFVACNLYTISNIQKHGLKETITIIWEGELK